MIKIRENTLNTAFNCIIDSMSSGMWYIIANSIPEKMHVSIHMFFEKIFCCNISFNVMRCVMKTST